MKDFKNKLDADNNLTLKFLAAKIGYDPEDPGEYGKAINLYVGMNIVTDPKHKTYKYICQMHFNKDSTELDQCIADNKANKNFLQ
jgi:hypothetical protein